MRKLVLIFLAMPFAASADLISWDVEISASDFSVLVGGDGSTPPAEPFDLFFTISFDNASDLDPTTDGLVVNHFSLGYALQFAYDAFADGLVLATAPVPGVDAGKKCFVPDESACLLISNISSFAPGLFAVYQVTSTSDIWRAESTNYSFSPVSVPEPGTLALLGIGLFGMALAKRRKA